MSAKPFLTIGEQIQLLESRGVKTSERTGRLLLREGYYSIVNGYKKHFIDAKASRAARDDRYAPGTTFDSLYDLFSFDRSLREITLRYLIRAEATARTAIAYCFAEAHADASDYLLQSSFCSRDEYAGYGKDEADYAAELSGLTGILGRRARRSGSEFVSHYREKYGAVPIWVLANDLTFGNLEHFFNLMKPGEKAAVCKAIASSTGRLGDRTLGYFDVDAARVSLEVLVKFRNICAHDERLYCARVGGRKNVNYAKMVWMLERYLTEDEFLRFISELLDLFSRGLDRNEAVAFVLRDLGFYELRDEIAARRSALHQTDFGAEDKGAPARAAK